MAYQVPRLMKAKVPVPTNKKNHSAVSRAARPLVRSIKLRNRSASIGGRYHSASASPAAIAGRPGPVRL